MILSFRNKALKLFFEKGDSSKLNPLHIKKIRNILTRLHAVTHPNEMNQPGYKMHTLQGLSPDRYSVRVDKNFRITFSYIAGNVIEVDYEDYH
jgi:toxin HigB-1